MHNDPMKRTVLLLLLAPVVLTGCQTIKAHNPFRHKPPAYKSAQQEQPLEVPPGLDQPATSDALTIPDTGTAASSASAAPAAGVPSVGEAPAAASTSLTLSDTPDSTYHRVGLALARGDLGKVTASDDASRTYQVAVDTVVTEKSPGGFFHRLFHHGKSETVTGNVTVSVAAQGSGSVVTATGSADAAARVIALLRQRLQ
jgi:uncharacterized lipoprotein